MSERSDLENSVTAAPSPSSGSSSPVVSTFRVLFQSAAVILRHRLHFLAIYAVTALPVSLILFSLAVSVHPIESRVRNLESLARLCHTRFEARQVLKESRAATLSALSLRAIYSLPTLALSLVSSAVASSSSRRPTLSYAAAALKDRWLRPLVTSICVYASMWAFLSVVATFRAILADSPFPRFAVFVAGSVDVHRFILSIPTGTKPRNHTNPFHLRRCPDWSLVSIIMSISRLALRLKSHLINVEPWSLEHVLAIAPVFS